MEKISVIKFGGSLAKNIAARNKFLRELASYRRNAQCVLVHGGGPEINLWLEKSGIKPKFANGLRFTDARTLEVVEMVLSGKVNKDIVASLSSLGVKAVGISSKDGKTVLCKRVAKLGYVGEPVKTDKTLVEILIKSGYLPVVSPIGIDSKHNTLNVNADSVAMALSIALKADELVYLTDVPGVLNEKKCTIPVIRLGETAKLVKKGIVSGGMIPKLNGCEGAVKKGVKKVWIIDGSKGLANKKGTVVTK